MSQTNIVTFHYVYPCPDISVPFEHDIETLTTGTTCIFLLGIVVNAYKGIIKIHNAQNLQNENIRSLERQNSIQLQPYGSYGLSELSRGIEQQSQSGSEFPPPAAPIPDAYE